MKKLDRYLGRTVLGACLGVLLLILALDSLFALVDRLTDDDSHYGGMELAWYLLLTVPGRLQEFTSLAVLVGCLVGLGVLGSNSELSVMRAAGVSTLRLLWGVLKPVLLLVALVMALAEWVVPAAEREATRVEAEAEGQASGNFSQHNVWHREGRWFINLRALDASGTLYGLRRYLIEPGRGLVMASYARRGVYQGDGWELQEVATTWFEAEDSATREEHQEKEFWPVSLRPELLGYLSADPAMLPLQGLWQYSHYLEAQGSESGRYRFAFWRKLLMPLAVCSLVLIAASFVFGSLRSVSLGQRVMVGLLVGMAFKFSLDLLGPASLVFGFSPLIAALAPVLVCLGVGAWMLRRVS